MKAYAVIGAAFGDEGKGAAVDALAASADRPIVVRFNGGAQAGHTVVTPDGVRHVFSHFGSGALAGAPTYLSHFFVVNPRCFLNEHAELAKAGANLKVTVNPKCLVTSPWHVMINRWAEIARGNGRHGSVGIGFGETVAHNKLRVEHVFADVSSAVRGYLIDQLRPWAVNRLAELGIPLTLGRRDAIYDEGTLETFRHEIELMRDLVTVDGMNALIGYDTVIFEGAQGLLLDQKRGYEFPYLTRSNTGLTNVVTLAPAAGIEAVDVRYVTRCYTTRHGAGPLDYEMDSIPGLTVVDPTNTEKPWQGKLRLAPFMPVERIAPAIKGDLARANGAIDIIPGIIVTCMDQYEPEIRAMAARSAAHHATDLPILYETWGPTRNDHRRP